MGVANFLMPAFVLGIVATFAPAHACTPGPDSNPKEEQDRALRTADVFYRGVIEQVNTRELVGEAANPERPIVTIRRTRTLWGEGAPNRLILPWAYLVQCPLPNLMEAYWQTVGGERQWLRPGWGVTVIGRRSDLVDRPYQVFVLIDGAPETADVVARFQELRLGW